MLFETARPNYLAVLSEKREHFWQIERKIADYARSCQERQIKRGGANNVQRR